ncbi:MAG: UDP-N-acetylglucosamine--N-acetylmuramyl-(pentapeptide) pyrophosphoryl-undecaprenol N-acetylglucosamine transferase [Gemmatimonadales bacterium]
MTTVLFAGGGTGGHLMPALAIATATRELEPAWRCFFAGAARGVDAAVLPERGWPHQLLPFQPLYRRQWWKNLRWPLLLPVLRRRIDALLDAERPAVVVGTGGYVSAPVLRRAAARGIPTALLELDVRPGIATRLAASRASAIWLAAAESRAALPAGVAARAVITGAPITPPDPSRRAAAAGRFGVDGLRPVLVITGGSQGALAINRVVADWLAAATSLPVQVIWSTGRGTHARFAALHRPPEVHVLPFIDPMSDAWSVADLAVARAGMMTLAELCAWRIPSVLVPLPTAAANHQWHNARAMADAGAAVLLDEQGLDATRFAGMIVELVGDPARRRALAAAAADRARPDAAIAIARAVVALAHGGTAA